MKGSSVLYLLYSVTNEEKYGDQSKQLHSTNQLLNHSVTIALQFKLCSTYYTVLWTKKTVREVHLQSIQLLWKYVRRTTLYWSHDPPTVKQYLCSSEQRNRTQRRTKVAPWCMLCSYFVWQKGTEISEWSDIEQWRNQVQNSLHCWVMLGWRHQLFSQLAITSWQLFGRV